MASRYGIETDNWRYADNSPVTSGRGRQANMLNAGLAAYQAVRGFQGDQADSEAAAAAKAAQQEQTQLGPETSSQKGSQYYDQDQSGGPADGNYVMNAAGRQGYNEDGSDMTAAQTAMEDRGVAPTYKQQYGLGASPTTFRDTQYTPAEKRTAGLQARADFYAGDSRIGSADKAEKYSGMLEEAQDRDYNRSLRPMQKRALEQGLKLTQQQITEGDRTATAKAREDSVRAAWENPMERLKSKFNTDVGRFGEGGMAGKQANAVPMPDGSGDHLVWQVDKDGKMVGDAKVMPKAELAREAQHDMLAELAVANPDKYLGEALRTGHTKAQLEATIKHYADSARHQLATEGLTGERLKIESKKLDAHIAEVNGRLSLLGRDKAGTPLTMYDKDDRPFLAVPIMQKDGRFKMERVEMPEGSNYTPKSGGLSNRPEKPPIDYKDWTTAFPPAPKETPEAHYRRYSDTFNRKAGGGGSAIGALAGGGGGGGGEGASSLPPLAEPPKGLMDSLRQNRLNNEAKLKAMHDAELARIARIRYVDPNDQRL